MLCTFCYMISGGYPTMNDAEFDHRVQVMTTTIERHLAHYIGLGELSLDQFVPQEKARRIREVLRHTPELSIAKAILGDDVTYGEIQMVMAVKS